MPVLAHDVYTDDPDEGPYVIFPTHAHQILSNFIHIIGVSVLSYCFARRTENDRFRSWLWWSNLTWARLLVILVFLDSWIFLAFSGILINGVGLSFSVPVCELGIFACIFFYAGSKALIYLFLVERVWVVCSAGKSVTRLESSIYRGCAIIVFGYIAIFIVMILGRYADIREDGVCIIGLHSFATIPLLSYDLFINVFLTSMFLWFLYREQSISERLRRLARRTALASGVALTTSCVNILMLALLSGKQLGWVCLGACAADVTVNALVLFWVTAGAARDPYWHGAWEPNDGAFAEPHELPPLHFPVSFVADAELGLSRVRTVEAGVHTQAQARSLNVRLVDLVESLHHKEFSEGASTDVHADHEDGDRDDADGDADDDRSGPEDIEWDITESASSGGTHFDVDDKDINMPPWRFTLDLEHPPALLTEHSEPDSPATHETAGSSMRLTTRAPQRQRQRQQQQHIYKQQKQPKQPKQRQRQWHSRPRRGRTRSRPRAASSPPATPRCSSPPSPPLPAFPPLSLSAPSTQSPPCIPQSARRSMLRSHSDSLVQSSDLAMYPEGPSQ